MEPIDFFVQNKTFFLVIHVLSVVLGMGSALVSDILFNFYSQNRNLHISEKRSLKILAKIVWYSLIVIILSGFAIFFSNPDKYEHSQKFLSKMVIMGVLLINGFVLYKLVEPHFDDRGLLKFQNKKYIRQIAFACGAVSLLSWTTICVLGVLKSIPVHMTVFISIYTLVLALCVVIALLVEHKTFLKATRVHKK